MKSYWMGKNIILRETTGDDTDLFMNEKGLYNTQILKNFDYIDFPRSKEHLSAIITKTNQNNENDDFSFTIETTDGKKIGYLIVFDCDKKNGTFKYGIFIKEEFQRLGLSREAVKIILDYYFNELRYNKVNVYIYDHNLASVNFHEKIGFVYEGRLRQMSYSQGKYHDTLYYGMLKSEFNTSNF